MSAPDATSTSFSVQGMGGSAVHASSAKNRSWTSLAFLVEALLLLLFLAGSIAITVNVSLRASSMGAEAAQLSQAASLARNVAEGFAADPSDAGALAQSEDGLIAVCDIVEDKGKTGTLYNATISVYEGAASDEALFVLDTAKFVAAPSGEAFAGAVTPEPIGTTIDADETTGDDMPGAADSSFVDTEAVTNG